MAATRILLSGLLLLFGPLLSLHAAAQDAYPSRAVRIVMPSAAGSPVEYMMRIMGEKYQAMTGQAFIVENRAGAGGILAAEVLAKSAPDGYTVMVGNIGQLSLNPATFSKLPYEVETFTPVVYLINTQYLFLVYPGMPVTSVRELVAFAKANPGKVSFASTQTGGPGHLAGVMFNQAAGIDMVHVPYKGQALALPDLLSGRVQAMFTPLGQIHEYIAAGKVRALAVTSERRIRGAPDVPSFTEQGFPDVVAKPWAGVVAPRGTPAPIAERLNGDLNKILQMPDIVEKLRATDQEPVGGTVASFGEFMKADRLRWAAAVKASGFKAD